MTVRISKSEMELLGYLHEQATRYDVGGQLHYKAVAETLQISDDQFQKNTSFLKGHGLVGTIDTHNSVFDGAMAIWLLPEGENLMRKIEDDLNDELTKAPDYTPSRGVKITLKAAGWLMDKSADAVIAIASAYLTK